MDCVDSSQAAEGDHHETVDAVGASLEGSCIRDVLFGMTLVSK